MINIQNLTKTFNGKTALANVSLQIERGSFVGVIGRSGAGKSTFLRCMNRLEEPTSGSVTVDEIDVTMLKGQALRNWRAKCAMVFQQFNLVGRLDVLTNVLMGRLNSVPSHQSLLKFWPLQDRALALSTLEQFGIANLAAQRAETLSGGQQQRVAIARALLQQPSIILADEPIASLDPRNTKVVMDALQHINRHFGMTIICNLHSLELARNYCGRLIGMSGGRIVFDGTPDDLTDAHSRELYGLEANDVMDVGDFSDLPDLRPIAA
jgi:phosphonate transport system ATP-binding protein